MRAPSPCRLLLSRRARVRTSRLVTRCDRSPAVTASSVPKHRLRRSMAHGHRQCARACHVGKPSPSRDSTFLCQVTRRCRQVAGQAGLGRAQWPVRGLFSAHDRISDRGETRARSHPASWCSLCPASKRSPAPLGGSTSGRSHLPGGLAPELLQGFSIPATGLICSSTCVPQNRPILSPRMAPPHLAASLPDSPRPPSAHVAAPCSSDTPQSSWGQRLPSGSAQRPKVSFPRPPRSPLCGARATQGCAAVSARGSCGCCVFLSRRSDACQTHCVVLPSRLTARNGRRQGPSVRRASRVAQTPAGAARPPRQGLRPAGVVRGGAGSSPPPQRLF